MDWLAIFFAIRLGFVTNAGMGLYEGRTKADEIIMAASMFTELEGEIQIAKTLFVGGSVNTHFRAGRNLVDFFPDEALYGFFVGLRYHPLELQYRHFCGHPVLSGIYNGEYKAFSYDEFSIKISNKP